MPIEPEYMRIVTRVHGYVELGMFTEADEEWNEVPVDVRNEPVALAVRLEILRGLKQWAAMQVIARSLAERDPGNPQWPILWAYATRRAESVQAARLILLDASSHHPGEAIIPYNLACYECRLGNMDAAENHLRAALKLEPKCRAMALEDDDLTPLRDLLKHYLTE